MNLVSVIIPTYNREKTIIKCIDSVLKQTYKNIEVIVVDDCSSDNTEKIVKSTYGTKVKYLKLKKNSGACIARNKGIDISKGEYIAFQDSDDVWHEDKLEKQLNIMIEQNADISFCNFNKYSTKSSSYKELPILQEGFISYEKLLEKSVVSTQCIVAKSCCFKKIKFDSNMPRLQDWDVILQLSKEFSVYHINEGLVDMYVQDDSISSHPEKGLIAIKYIIEKNKEAIYKNKNILRNIYINVAYYKILNKQNPKEEYKEALKIKFSFEIFLRYILSKLHFLFFVYKIVGKI